MSIETDARQEAERRWPALNPGDVELTYPRGALRATARKAFEAGAVWASEQPDREPSDAKVRAEALRDAATWVEDLAIHDGLMYRKLDDGWEVAESIPTALRVCADRIEREAGLK